MLCVCLLPVKVVTLSFPILVVLKAVITKLEKDPVLGGMVVGSPEVYGRVLLTLKKLILRPTFQDHLHPSPWRHQGWAPLSFSYPPGLISCASPFPLLVLLASGLLISPHSPVCSTFILSWLPLPSFFLTPCALILQASPPSSLLSWAHFETLMATPALVVSVYRCPAGDISEGRKWNKGGKKGGMEYLAHWMFSSVVFFIHGMLGTTFCRQSVNFFFFFF